MLIKREHGFLQRFYLWEITVGTLITMKQWFFGKNITYQYPEQRRQYSPRYRGQHYIKTVNGVENCTACMLCPTVCPADCIHIEAGERADKEKFPVKFEIDILRCCFCGFCEEACPKDAIKLSNIYEMADYERRVYDKDFLLIQRSKK
jgi:NADH-quinone oxidoreductase subunit I